MHGWSVTAANGGEGGRDGAEVSTRLPGEEGIWDGAGHIGQLSGAAGGPCLGVGASEDQQYTTDEVHGGASHCLKVGGDGEQVLHPDPEVDQEGDWDGDQLCTGVKAASL